MNTRALLPGFLSLGVCLGLTAAGAVPGANWPGFRGLSAAGVAAHEKPPLYFGPTSNLLWKTELPPGHSSPIIWQDSLFATGAESNRLLTFCLERCQGHKRWEASVTVPELERMHRMNSVATPTPVTDGRAVYAYFSSFGLLAYDWQGKELWRKPLPLPQTFRNQGTGTSPILAEDKLLLFVQLGRDSYLLALNPKDGQELWRAPMPAYNSTYSTPIYWQEHDRGCLGLLCANRFTAFRLADGQAAWWLGGLPFEPCSTPVVAGDLLVLSAAGVQGDPANITLPPPFEAALKQFDKDGDRLISYEEIPAESLYTDRQAAGGEGNMSLRAALALVGMKKEEKLDQTRWEQLRAGLSGFRDHAINAAVVLTVRTGGSQDVTRSHVRWKETKAVPEVPSPLVYQNRIYLVRSGGMLACRDLETGKLLYDKPTDSRGGYFASPVAAGGQLYLASDRGTVTVIKAGEAFEVLARNELNERILASPAMADDTLYIRSARHLWAFGPRSLPR